MKKSNLILPPHMRPTRPKAERQSFELATAGGRVILRSETAITNIAFSPAEARNFATALLYLADSLEPKEEVSTDNGIN